MVKRNRLDGACGGIRGLPQLNPFERVLVCWMVSALPGVGVSKKEHGDDRSATEFAGVGVGGGALVCDGGCADGGGDAPAGGRAAAPRCTLAGGERRRRPFQSQGLAGRRKTCARSPGGVGLDCVAGHGCDRLCRLGRGVVAAAIAAASDPPPLRQWGRPDWTGASAFAHGRSKPIPHDGDSSPSVNPATSPGEPRSTGQGESPGGACRQPPRAVPRADIRTNFVTSRRARLATRSRTGASAGGA